MIFDKLLLSAPALVLLSSTAWTQAPAPFEYWSQNKIEWPTAEWGACADLTRSVCGDLNGDLVRDVVVLGAGKACLLFAPYGHASVTQIGSGATFNDIDIVPSGSTQRDALAAVGGSGLSVFTYSEASRTFVPAETVLDNWVGAKIVRSRNINNDGPADFVGVKSDSKTVIVRQNTPGTSNYTDLTFQCYSQSTSSIKDVVLVQWDNEPALEIALLTDYGIEVYKPAGALLRKSATPGLHGDALAAFQSPVAGREVLAWLVTNSAGTSQSLYAYRGMVAPTLQPQPDLTFINGVALTAGGGDLALSHRGTYAPVLLHNVATAAGEASNPYFAAATQLALSDPPPEESGLTPELAREASANDAHVVWADLDGDEQLDLLVPIEAASAFVVLRSSEPPDLIHAVGEVINPDVYRGGVFLAGDGSQPRTAMFDLNFDIVPIDATDIELVSWRQESLINVGAPLTSTEVISRRYTVDHGQNLYHVDVPIPGDDHAACMLANVYWFDVRFTRRDLTYPFELTRAWPSHYAVFSTTDDPVLYHWQTQPQDSAFANFSPPVGACDPNSVHGVGNVSVGPSGIEKRALPPTQTGNIPHVPINPAPPTGTQHPN